MPEDHQPVEWFEWGSTLAVVGSTRAYSVQPQLGGWREVSPADVTWDGRAISEISARAHFVEDFTRFGEPPLV